MGGLRPMWLLSVALLTVLPSAHSELTPPYFNLAEGRKISASSTCGLDIDGPELYCKLVGSHTDDQQNKTALFDFHDDHFHTEALSRQGHVVIQGQVRWFTLSACNGRRWCEREDRKSLNRSETGSDEYFMLFENSYHRFGCWPLGPQAECPRKEKNDFRFDKRIKFFSFITSNAIIVPQRVIQSNMQSMVSWLEQIFADENGGFVKIAKV